MSKKEFEKIIKVPGVNEEGYYIGMIDAHISPKEEDKGIYNYPGNTAFLSTGQVAPQPKGFKKNQVAKLKEDVWVFEDVQIQEEIVEEHDEIIELKISDDELVRTKRNSLLKESDYIVLINYEKGTKVPRNWIIYRQMLRDIPSQNGFPSNVQWPTKPE